MDNVITGNNSGLEKTVNPKIELLQICSSIFYIGVQFAFEKVARPSHRIYQNTKHEIYSLIGIQDFRWNINNNMINNWGYNRGPPQI